MDKSNEIGGLLEIIDLVANFILAIPTPTATAIGLLVKIGSNVLREGVVEGSIKPSKEESIKITEEFYNALIEAVRNATSRVTEVKRSLETEITAVTGLRGEVDAVDELHDAMEFPLFNELQKLTGTLNQFIVRHGGGTKYRKRRALSDYNLNWLSKIDMHHLHLTRKKREMQFWKVQLSPQNSVFLMADIGH